MCGVEEAERIEGGKFSYGNAGETILKKIGSFSGERPCWALRGSGGKEAYGGIRKTPSGSVLWVARRGERRK